MMNLTDEKKRAYGNELKDMLIKCEFGGGQLCTADDFDWFYDFYMGNCYKFNANGRLEIGKDGSTASLTIVLVLGDSSLNYSYLTQLGIRLMIHNSSLFHPLIFENGQNLAPGYRTSMLVRRTYYDRLAEPYNDCIDNVTPSNPQKTRLMKVMFESLNQSTYDQTYCFNLAFQEILDKTCNCVNPSYPYSNETVAKCIDDNQMECKSDIFQIVFSNPSFYFHELCPKVCDHFEYDTQLSLSKYPTRRYWNALKKSATSSLSNSSAQLLALSKISQISSYEDARENILAFKVYYDDLSYNLIKESPYWSYSLLLASFGGTIVLFFGMSVLSFLEFFELAFYVGSYLFKFINTLWQKRDTK
jgi:hypothetical protein